MGKANSFVSKSLCAGSAPQCRYADKRILKNPNGMVRPL
jgi:hypothetical protein